MRDLAREDGGIFLKTVFIIKWVKVAHFIIIIKFAYSCASVLSTRLGTISSLPLPSLAHRFP